MNKRRRPRRAGDLRNVRHDRARRLLTRRVPSDATARRSDVLVPLLEGHVSTRHVDAIGNLETSTGLRPGDAGEPVEGIGGDDDLDSPSPRRRRSSELARPKSLHQFRGSTSSAEATLTIVSSVGEPFPSSSAKYVRWTPASSASPSWLTGGSSLVRLRVSAAQFQGERLAGC